MVLSLQNILTRLSEAVFILFEAASALEFAPHASPF